MIREGNYTNFPGFYGMLMRNCYTFPLSSNRDTMKKFLSSMDTVLQHGDFMLVYPEQSMWWNYRKPKPLKKGAYTFAAKNHVPVLPCFITMEDSDILGDDGFMCRNTRYTLQSRFIRTHRKHRQKMWMRCAGKMLLCGNRFTKSFTEFPWYMILRKQCSMWENRPISHKNRYQTAGGCLRWFFHKGIDRKAV